MDLQGAAVIADVIAGITAVGALATAGGVGVGARQLLESRRQALTTFEDKLASEYRALIRQFPADAFYTDRTVELTEELRGVFYRYFDLSNEQLYLARLGRISTNTDAQWRDGIRGNLTKLPSFQKAWDEVAAHVPDDFFEDLRALVPPRELQICEPTSEELPRAEHS